MDTTPPGSKLGSRAESPDMPVPRLQWGTRPKRPSQTQEAKREQGAKKSKTWSEEQATSNPASSQTDWGSPTQWTPCEVTDETCEEVDGILYRLEAHLHISDGCPPSGTNDSKAKSKATKRLGNTQSRPARVLPERTRTLSNRSQLSKCGSTSQPVFRTSAKIGPKNKTTKKSASRKHSTSHILYLQRLEQVGRRLSHLEWAVRASLYYDGPPISEAEARALLGEVRELEDRVSDRHVHRKVKAAHRSRVLQVAEKLRLMLGASIAQQAGSGRDSPKIVDLVSDSSSERDVGCGVEIVTSDCDTASLDSTYHHALAPLARDRASESGEIPQTTMPHSRTLPEWSETRGPQEPWLEEPSIQVLALETSDFPATNPLSSTQDTPWLEEPCTQVLALGTSDFPTTNHLLSTQDTPWLEEPCTQVLALDTSDFPATNPLPRPSRSTQDNAVKRGVGKWLPPHHDQQVWTHRATELFLNSHLPLHFWDTPHPQFPPEDLDLVDNFC